VNEQLELAVDTEGEAVLVRACGEVDGETSEIFEQTLRDQLVAAKALIVDLTGIEFFASAGLNTLVTVHKQAKANAVPFVVVAAQRAVLRPITVLGLDRTLTLRASVEEALAEVAR
jgi:anti-sigma B factor antagonist